MILRLQEQGYNTVTKLAVKAFNYASNMIMQTAIRVSERLSIFMKKSRQITFIVLLLFNQYLNYIYNRLHNNRLDIKEWSLFFPLKQISTLCFCMLILLFLPGVIHKINLFYMCGMVCLLLLSFLDLHQSR